MSDSAVVPALRIDFYRAANGDEPARIWLKKLDKAERNALSESIKVAQFCWPIAAPMTRKVAQSLWEIRCNSSGRTFCVVFTVQSDHMILMHGYESTGVKVPKAELVIAAQYLWEIKGGQVMLKLSRKGKPKLFGTGPVMPVDNIRTTANFYCDVLGFTIDFVMGTPPTHGSVTRDRVGIQFVSAPQGYSGENYPGWFYFFVDCIDDLYAQYQSKSVTISRELESHSHGMREFEIRDTNGYRLRFGQYL